MEKIVDLSPAVPHGFKGPPSTDLGVQLEVRTKPGYWQSAQTTLMSLHTGCHVESALHVVEGGESIDEVALERVMGEAVLLDVRPVEAMDLIDVPDLEGALARLESAGEYIRPGDILLLCTGWAERAIGQREYFRRSPGLTEGAARWLVRREPKCIGCDFFEEPAAREPGWKPEEFVVHNVILGAGIPLVEGLVNLGSLPPRCRFFAPFYKFAGVESAPARAFAIVEG
ncbi:cyclase family protein [Rubrobacter calidifluminis]|uniref:cyclase family protein n=1 Tax=Rubrobacter calidifluminis TaxID=1392640 RepID=UPI002362C101|nr:cyclase family protein [Rubrobacter calidifluminis]